MSRSVTIAAGIALVGAVFFLQGIGVLGGGAMVGSSFWAVVGAIMVVVAALIGWRSIRPARRG